MIPGPTVRVEPWMLAVGVVGVILIALLGFIAIQASRDPVAQAQELARQGRFIEAADILTEFTDSNPSNERALFELGKLQWQSNRFPEAASSFEKAGNINENNIEAAQYAVAALSRLGQNTLNRQIAALQRLTERSSDDSNAWLMLGLARGNANNLRDQSAALERALQIDPANAVARQYMGIAHALSGNIEEGRGELMQANMLLESSGDALASLGFLAAMEGQSDEAVANLERALEGQTSVPGPVLTELGVQMLAQGRFGDAERYLQQAIQGQSGDAKAQFFHAASLLARARSQEALLAFQNLSRESSGNYAGESAVYVAHILLNQGRADQARDAINRAMTLGAGGASMQTVLGRVLLAEERESEAQRAFEEALGIDPGYPPAHLELGLLLVKREIFSEAIVELEQYVQLLGDSREGTRAREIEGLVEQLKQTLEGR